MGDGAATECGGSEGFRPWSLAARIEREIGPLQAVTLLSGFAGAQPRQQR
jgi:hypothetical protein